MYKSNSIFVIQIQKNVSVMLTNTNICIICKYSVYVLLIFDLLFDKMYVFYWIGRHVHMCYYEYKYGAYICYLICVQILAEYTNENGLIYK